MIFILLILFLLTSDDCLADEPSVQSGSIVEQEMKLVAADDHASPEVLGSRPKMMLLTYCVLIVVSSLVGGWLPSWVRLTHTRMQTIVSFVGGLMLGIGVLHLMPHAAHELGSARPTASWMMVGIVMMFALIRLFHFHNHDPVTPSAASTCSHGHDHDHDVPKVQLEESGKNHTTAECHSLGHRHGISWTGIALGLSVHTLIDGLALGASVRADSLNSPSQMFFGLATFLAILLHKPLDAVSITSLMVAGGWGKKSINLMNAGFALMCPIGAGLFLFGLTRFSGYQREMLGTSLAFSAGVFICIALADLLPEMEFHSHNKVRLTLALAAGIGLSWALTLLHASHLH